MKKLETYLQKNGYEYKKAIYGSNYFYNATPVLYDGLQVSFQWNGDRRQEEKLKKYCQKKGYVIFFEWHNLYTHGFTIATAGDRKRIELYDIYERKARQEVELYIHNANIKNNFPLISNHCRKIMDKYGMMYNTAMQEKATA